MSNSLELREFFHLCFLRHFAGRMAGRGWAVKGGICLRLFHRSPRLSEDMDLDIEPRVRLDTLCKCVEAILRARAFSSALITKGITDLSFTSPKQTQTVQRWKVALTAGGPPLSTKLEFSRRRSRPPYSSGTPDADILARFALPPFAAQYYDAARMIAQKIEALASPSRTAARDLFDLDHLFTTLKTDPVNARPAVDPVCLGPAARGAAGYRWSDFRAQVVPYLDEGLMRSYAGADSFKALQDRVLSALSALKTQP